jgi:hypothetical protein
MLIAAERAKRAPAALASARVVCAVWKVATGVEPRVSAPETREGAATASPLAPAVATCVLEGASDPVAIAVAYVSVVTYATASGLGRILAPPRSAAEMVIALYVSAVGIGVAWPRLAMLQKTRAAAQA